MEMIETRYGLLDHLFSLDVLSSEEFDDVRVIKPVGRTVARLLEVLTSKGDQLPLQSVLKALTETQQLHVVNFLKGDGGKEN